MCYISDGSYDRCILFKFDVLGTTLLLYALTHIDPPLTHMHPQIHFPSPHTSPLALSVNGIHEVPPKRFMLPLYSHPPTFQQ